MQETETDLNPAAAFFNIGSIIESTGTQFGIGNENYHVKTPKGEFILRRLWEQTIDGLKNEVSIQQQLGAAGVLTAQLIQGEGGSYYYQHLDQIITGSRKIEGVHPTKVGSDLAKRMGSLLARFHQSVTTLPIETTQWLNVKYALNKAEPLDAGPTKTLISQRINDNRDLFEIDLPQGIIHGDLYIGNLLITPDNQLAVFDFETAERNLYIIDIARSLLDLDPEDAFLEGYQQIRKLEDLEISSLQKAKLYVSSAMAAWLIDRGQLEGAEEILKKAG